MFPRRPTTKIPACNQDAGPLVARFMQHKVGILFSVAAKPPIVKQKLSKPGPLDPLQKLLRNDLVGVHIDPVQWRHTPAMYGEWFHCLSLFAHFNSRYSSTTTVQTSWSS